MPANKTDRLKAAHDRLAQAVESTVSGDDWARMLKVASNFHRYSFQNQLLIFSQRPDATLVAGYRRWQELGRFVKRGEKGIQIFAPVSGKCRSCDGAGGIIDAGEFLTCSRCMGSGKYSGFKLVYVFDIEQTEGFTDPPPRDVAEDVSRLRSHLDAIVPSKRLDDNLLIATWNIRAFGDLTDDVTRGRPGNDERMAFLFDTRRVKPSGLACELMVPEEWLDEVRPDALDRQFARTPTRPAFAPSIRPSSW